MKKPIRLNFRVIEKILTGGKAQLREIESVSRRLFKGWSGNRVLIAQDLDRLSYIHFCEFFSDLRTLRPAGFQIPELVAAKFLVGAQNDQVVATHGDHS